MAAAKKYDSLEMKVSLPASPAEVYAAWLDGEQHEEMTGGGPATAGTQVGDAFTAWDGYITGKNLELVPGKRIVQSWRTNEFPDSAEDSRLEVLLEPEGKGTLLSLIHTHIPEGQGAAYETGWEDYYFAPMTVYFS